MPPTVTATGPASPGAGVGALGRRGRLGGRALTAALAWLGGSGGRDAGLLVARVALAWIFVYHGAGTLFGAFGGPGVHRQALYFASVAHLHPATFFAVVNGCLEFFGGIAVGLGVLPRLGAAGLVLDMVVAMVTVSFAQGFESSAAGSGYELNVALAALAAAVALAGPGRVVATRLPDLLRRA